MKALLWNPDGHFNPIPLLGVLLLSWVFLTTSYQTTFVFDNPIYTAVWACVVAGAILLFYGVYDPNQRSYSPRPAMHAFMDDLQSFRGVYLHAPSSRATWIRMAKLPGQNVLALMACMLCVRIELFRQLTVHDECAPPGYAYAIPICIAAYDYFRNQRHQPVEGRLPMVERGASSRLDFLRIPFRHLAYWLIESRQRYLISTALLALAGLLASSFQRGQPSTYICSIVSGQTWRIPLFRFVSVILDAAILVWLAKIETMWIGSAEQQRKTMSRQWGSLLLGVAAFWIFFACVISIFGAHGGITFRIRSHYVQSIVSQGCLVAIFTFSALQLIPRYGVLTLSMLAGFVALYLSSLAILYDGRQPYPFINSSDAITTYAFMFAAAIAFLWAWSASEEDIKQLPKPPHIVIRLLFILLLCGGLFAAFLQANITSGHPIDMLISNARDKHSTFSAQASTSTNFVETVAEYQRRYKMPPPPGFDKWYEYATSRESPIIDDFDQIYNDLLPFWVYTPQRLRDFTHEMATNPYNNIGAVSVRNGTSIAQQDVWPSHAWMVSAIATMVGAFAKDLPDMDIAFNLDDQPRLAVSYETISKIRETARPQTNQDLLVDSWSKNRSAGWASVQPPDQTRKSAFSNNDGLRTFDKYVRGLCPAFSQTRSNRIWDRKNICLSCVRPHSIGQFPSDWDAANDICHQPDLAELHGVFSGPTGFVVTRDLLPVFSQSTISGFSDILYPSPWNYVDHVKYEPSETRPDPAYDEKENTLFWIGSTSEGMGSKERWKGLSRQRFTHLVNNNTESRVSILLPTPNSPTNYTYQILPGTSPTTNLGLQTNVHVTDPIKHCGQCDTQKAEFGTAGRVDFQSSWQYRYLFDLDGAGFSGRFLPFLQSRSLPLKAGIFRQWFDSRLTPWLHFVPVDLRLHGVWSTLAYFAGVNGTVSGGQGIWGIFSPPRPVQMKPHDTEGREIAEEGRKWAEKAIRKEDMEIYFFRLLLEWGRLTDDQRDILGFKLD